MAGHAPVQWHQCMAGPMASMYGYLEFAGAPPVWLTAVPGQELRPQGPGGAILPCLQHL